MAIRKLKREELYFNTLYDKVLSGVPTSYQNVCKLLYDTPFEYSVFMDKNRYSDGLSLRDRLGFDDIDSPCNCLEVIVALAERMETDIMTDPLFGDRTSQWFMSMLTSLGLSRYDDSCYNDKTCWKIVDKWLHREYSKNGKGGLFTFRKPVPYDPREAEIWALMNWWISERY